jgi:hypothetical protein
MNNALIVGTLRLFALRWHGRTVRVRTRGRVMAGGAPVAASAGLGEIILTRRLVLRGLLVVDVVGAIFLGHNKRSLGPAS